MSGLTLPLRTGQKCVTRDGTNVTIGAEKGVIIGVLTEANARMPYCVYTRDGRCSSGLDQPLDVVADQCTSAPPAPKGHPHAESMALYAQDAAECAEPWTLWEGCGDSVYWYPLTRNPTWDVDVEYRRKPRTININGHEVPEPLRVAPAHGVTIYRACPKELWLSSQWQDSPYQRTALARGLLHATSEAAEVHARALLSFTEVK